MRRFILLSVLILLLPSSYHGQSPASESDVSNNLTLERLLLISDLQNLETKATKLDAPLARALAKAEIADAAWMLDEVWAKNLLREAYELTLPDEKEQTRLRNRLIGAAPTIPTTSDVARNSVRSRVLSIAKRDKAFVAQLAQLGAQQLGRLEEHYSYANLSKESKEAKEAKVPPKE